MKYLVKTVVTSVGLVLIGLTSGCATPEKPLYSWGTYQKEVYNYFKKDGSSSTEQIIALEKQSEEAKSKGLKLPPGFYAHLGMLYAEVGQLDKVQQHFDIEKQLYPESTAYMDFLSRNLKK
jgi:hypothetical protein